VENNTIDMYLSGHNGIGIASGVNVTVNENTVYGCRKINEGGIEVESNPIHNRLIGISENITVTRNIVSKSYWGVYVRIMLPDHINWLGNPLKSKNILIEGNTISDCLVGINLLHGDSIIVKDNYLNSTQPLKVDQTNVLNYTISGNLDYSNYSPNARGEY
jgi:parallel beta-helix repeat protein